MDHWADLFPIVFFPLKLLVLAVGMYFAIKWHYDKDEKIRKEAADRKRPPTQSG